MKRRPGRGLLLLAVAAGGAWGWGWGLRGARVARVQAARGHAPPNECDKPVDEPCLGEEGEDGEDGDALEGLPRGVDPADRARYEGTAFVCGASGATFPRTVVNDGYCDCEDGSDEPGTAACPRGWFYCHNRGVHPQYLESWRVDDGVCDCHDGTDESEDGEVYCEDDSLKLKMRWALEEKVRRNRHEAGLPPRQQHQAAGETLWREDERELIETPHAERVDALRTRVATLDALLHKLDAVDGQALPFHRRLGKGSKELQKKAAEGIRDKVPSWQIFLDEACPGASEDAPERQRCEEWRAKRFPLTYLCPGSPPKPEDHDSLRSGGWVTQACANPLFKGARSFDPMWKVYLTPAVLWALKVIEEEELGALQATARKLRGKRDLGGVDFGPFEGLKHAYYSLHGGECYSTRDDQYSYEVCPFRQATQKKLTGTGSFDLGGPGELLPSGEEMVFAGGARCHTGVHRKVRLKLECGSLASLGGFAETSTCEYEATLTTPAVCRSEEEDRHFKRRAASGFPGWGAPRLHTEL